MANDFNPLRNFNQGFDVASRRREADAAKAEQERLRTQRESFVNAKNKGDALKQLIIDQPKIGFAFMKELQTDEKGLDALIEDSVMLKHLLEIDPTGASAMELLQSRDQTIISGVLGGNRNSLKTRQSMAVLQNEGPQKLHENLSMFIDIPNQLKGQKQSSFQKGDKGLVFDPSTGSFTIDPVAKARFDEIAANAVSKGGLDFKDRQGLNKDVTAIIKDTVNIRKAASELDKLKTRGTAASKLGAVFKFMKSLDPTSVVRESEQGQVYSAQGAGAQLAGQINGLLGKGKLTEAGFLDLVNTAKTIANANITATSTQVGSLLDTFEDTIPQSFKGKVSERVPKLFNMGTPTAAPVDQGISSQGFTSPSGIKFTVGG